MLRTETESTTTMTTEVTETTQASEPTFDAIPLSDAVRRAVNEMGWENPTPVQLATYEPACAGRDLIVQARTGTGKTGAFGIVIADKLVTNEPGVQALILAPTRELALQSAREMQKIGAHSGITTTAVYGGAPIERQVRELDDGAQVVSGTPGRVLDHLKRGTLDARNLSVLVLDEADEMLSMGFAEELNAIIDRLPEKRQTLLFSATVDRAIERVASRHMTDPERIELSSDAVGATTIDHYTYLVTGQGKVNDLIKIIEVEDPESAIIFCNTKAETEMVSQRLSQSGYNATWLNGDLAQSDREKVMARTRAGKLRFLVATDVAARGIDVSHVTHVMNYTFPPAIEQYIHRTGRTGRAGRTGTAISIVSPQELGSLYYLRLQYKIFPVERSLPNAGEERTRREADRIGLLDAAFPNQPTEMDLAVARRLMTHADAERLLGGLIATFFGQGENVDEEAAAARRERNPEPVADEGAKASDDGKKKKKRKKDDDRDKKRKKKKASSPAPAEASASASSKDEPSAPPAREDSKAESASKAPAAEAKSEDKSETA
ncbi:MAG: heavy metal transporter, partial [Deltaproteobacteria bacterium]